MVVSILDDGVDHTHPDLRDNFVSQSVACVYGDGGFYPSENALN